MNKGNPSVAITPGDKRSADARNSGIRALAKALVTLGLMATLFTGCGQRGPLTLPSAAPPASSPTPAS